MLVDEHLDAMPQLDRGGFPKFLDEILSQGRASATFLGKVAMVCGDERNLF